MFCYFEIEITTKNLRDKMLLTLTLRLNTFQIFQGVSSPTMNGAWSKWAPPLERSILLSIPMSGSSFGTFVTLPLAGLIADELGWEAVFYVTGKFT